MPEKTAAVFAVAALLGGCATARVPVERFLPAEGCYEKLSQCDPGKGGELSRVYASGNTRVSIPLRPLWQLVTDGVPVKDERDLEYRKFLGSHWGMSAVASVLEVRDGVLRSSYGVVFDAGVKAGDTRNREDDELPARGRRRSAARPRFRSTVLEATDRQVVVEDSMKQGGHQVGFMTSRDYWTAGQGLSRRDLGGRCLFEIRRVECPANMWMEFSKLPPHDFEIGGNGSTESDDRSEEAADPEPSPAFGEAKAPQEALAKLHAACKANTDCGTRQRCLKWFAQQDGEWKEVNSCELRCNPIRGDRDCPSPLECLRTLNGVTDTCQDPGGTK